MHSFDTDISTVIGMCRPFSFPLHKQRQYPLSKDFFAHKANSYEQNKSRVDNVDNIANSIIKNVAFQKTMHLMDFGSGTGLLLERVAPWVRKITAVDISSSMNRRLAEKRYRLDCELDIVELDLEKSDIDEKFDGVISSMTMHHIRDIDALFVKLHKMLKEDGFIAIADLDLEDGSFHTEDTGVFHYGFDRDAIADVAKKAGFSNVEVTTASMVHKPQGDFPVFLLKA
jgi:cyclopropane fatty-acyl-phospholipid synthase-like methyltransferase